MPDGDRVWVANTHLQLDPPNQPGAASEQRANGISAILRHLPGESRPTILMGDFNAQPGSPELDALGGHWTDCWTTAHPEQNGFTFPALPGAVGSERIDYLFVSGEARVEGADVLLDDATKMASDYYSVIADLQLR